MNVTLIVMTIIDCVSSKTCRIRDFRFVTGTERLKRIRLLAMTNAVIMLKKFYKFDQFR